MNNRQKTFQDTRDERTSDGRKSSPLEHVSDRPAHVTPLNKAALPAAANGAIQNLRLFEPDAKPTAGLLQRAYGNRHFGEVANQGRQVNGSLIVQPKLVLSQPNDKYELEADRVADQVMRQVEGTVEIGPLHCPRSGIARRLTTITAEDKAINGDFVDSEASSNVSSDILSSGIGGEALPEPTRQSFEKSFGADFRTVRVHADARADELNQQLNSEAFTTGHDIFFRHGRYKPTSSEGRFLLAHELTHTLQQKVSNSNLWPGIVQCKLVKKIKGGEYESEEFGQQSRERPKKATQIIDPPENVDRGPTPKSLSLLHDPKNENGANDIKLGFHGGHIIGLHIGGPDQSYNVVPMYPGFNVGNWKNLEESVKKDSTSKALKMQVDITYHDQVSTTVPQTFAVTIFEKKNNSWQRNSQQTLTQPDDIPITSQFSPQDLPKHLGSNPTERDGVISNAANKVSADNLDSLFNLETGETASQYILKNKHLPPSRRAAFPDNPADRPYEYLDLMQFSQPITGVGNIQFLENNGFTPQQKEVILKTNMARNGGSLKSDDINDPYPALSERGAVEKPEIDHIIPQSLGGSNYFSNARVVSWFVNNKVARVKNINKLIDVKKIAYPSLGNDSIANQMSRVVPIILMKGGGPIRFLSIVNILQTTFSVNVSDTYKNAIRICLDDLRDKNEVIQNLDLAYQIFSDEIFSNPSQANQDAIKNALEALDKAATIEEIAQHFENNNYRTQSQSHKTSLRKLIEESLKKMENVDVSYNIDDQTYSLLDREKQKRKKPDSPVAESNKEPRNS